MIKSIPFGSRILGIFLVLSLLTGYAPAALTATLTAAAATPFEQKINREAAPLRRTNIELTDRTTNLRLFEERLQVESIYRLQNPTAKNQKLTLTLPYQDISLVPPEYLPQVTIKKNPVLTDVPADIHYRSPSHSYTWDLAFEAGEEQVLTITYSLPRTVNNEGLLSVNYFAALSSNWAEHPVQTKLTVTLEELHPGQIRQINPAGYSFQGSSFVWSFPAEEGEYLQIKADIFSEKRQWEALLTQEELGKLTDFIAEDDYLGAAELYRVKALSAKREDRLQFKEVQAYYLHKAGQPKDALPIWEELYQGKSRSPRAYWFLGRFLLENPEKKGTIEKLYERVKELQVNPLLQEWLAGQVPENKLNLSPPQNPNVAVKTDSSQEGLSLQIKALDTDGDLKKIIIRYHWENEPIEEKIIEPTLHFYEHNTSIFIPAPGPLKRLFYEVTLLDKKGNKAATGEKIHFYLNNQLQCTSYALDGAILVLADYSLTEQDKVEKWFRSYIKLAREADFIPIEQKQPYFIFLGKEQEFMKHYSGPHFIIYAPAPFEPDQIKPAVHRSFLSYWYGDGWNVLPESDLKPLGDALLLGRGHYSMLLRYLSEKDPVRFAELLVTIGQGQGWLASLQGVYGLHLWETQFRALWHAYGNMVIAALLIFCFALLGKTGHITRMIIYFREKR